MNDFMLTNYIKLGIIHLSLDWKVNDVCFIWLSL